MPERPLVTSFEINVAQIIGQTKFGIRSSHICRVIVPSNRHVDLIEILGRLKISFPPEEYAVTVYGIPYETRHQIDTSKLTYRGIGYPKD